MNERPLVSIVICTRNRAGSMNGTLRSLAAICSEHPWEVLVVDNASTDNTKEVISAADDCGGRLRYLLASQIGLGAARDFGWRATRGAIVSFTDDDCYLDPGYVDAVVRAFDEQPDVGCVGGRILLFDAEDARVTIDERNEPFEIAPYQFVDAGTLQGANLSFRRLVLDLIGGIDPALGAGTPFPSEDIDAVAATLWAGSTARFDPRPVVHHHHGRRGGDIDKLFVGYDRGRGAYYAKYVLRRDTRDAYLRGWWGFARKHSYGAGVVRFKRELQSAAHYIAFRKRYGFMLLAAPVALAAMGFVVLQVTQRAAMRRLRERGWLR